MILRPGYITPEMIEKVIGEVRVDPGIIGVGFRKETESAGYEIQTLCTKG